MQQAFSIPLADGRLALVDEADYLRFKDWKWRAIPKRGMWYAVSNPPFAATGGNRKTVYMHRLILDVAPDIEVDHRNHDGLDNQRGNLRPATRQQQMRNTRKRAGCTSRFKGVHWAKHRQKWWARICVDGRMRSLGLFDNEIDAARRYNEEAVKLFGEFANLNQLEGDSQCP